MKLTEIIDLKQIDRKMTVPYNHTLLSKKHSNAFDAMVYTPQTDPSSKVGSFSYGRPNKNQPQEFLKKGSLPVDLEDDGHYQYIKAISKLMKSNPFVPRVTQVVRSTDINNKTRPSYKMETLFHADQIAPEIMLAMLERMSQPWAEEYRIRYHNRLSSIDIADFIAHKISSDIVDAKSHPDNKQLSQVITIIRRVISHNRKFVEDIHRDNIMFRQIGKGIVQLVITDPIADSRPIPINW